MPAELNIIMVSLVELPSHISSSFGGAIGSSAEFLTAKIFGHGSGNAPRDSDSWVSRVRLSCQKYACNRDEKGRRSARKASRC